MARTVKKTARKDQYRAIMAKDGIRFEDCRVLAFAFEYPKGPEILHIRIMLTEPQPTYYLFDLFEQVAQIVIPNDESTAARIQELAEQVGGKKTTPNLI